MWKSAFWWSNYIARAVFTSEMCLDRGKIITPWNGFREIIKTDLSLSGSTHVYHKTHYLLTLRRLWEQLWSAANLWLRFFHFHREFQFPVSAFISIHLPSISMHKLNYKLSTCTCNECQHAMQLMFLHILGFLASRRCIAPQDGNTTARKINARKTPHIE